MRKPNIGILFGICLGYVMLCIYIYTVINLYKYIYIYTHTIVSSFNSFKWQFHTEMRNAEGTSPIRSSRPTLQFMVLSGNRTL